MRQSSLRVSSLTQLFILPRTNFWKRQYRLRPMLLSAPRLYRFNKVSTTRCDFSFFWMQERMRRMMLGTTLRFYICLDFLPFLWEPPRGRYSSSSIFLKQGQFLKLEGRESLSVLVWASAGRELRMMVSTTDCLHSDTLSNFSDRTQFSCWRGCGSIQEQPLRARSLGKTKQNCIGSHFTIWRVTSLIYIYNSEVVGSIQRI